MNRIVVERRLDAEGVLQLTLPFGADDAGQEVLVTFEPVCRNKEMAPNEWRAAVLATAGGWEGEFERPTEGEPEEREPLS
jgi:hypothetical protein